MAMWRAHIGAGGAAVVVMSFVSWACFPGGSYPTTAFRCWPGGPEPRCPGAGDEQWLCCSDDAAALELNDLTVAALPNYAGETPEAIGTPLFSAANNDLSYSGMCIKKGSVPIQGTLRTPGVEGCPIPCNPSWDAESIETVCGEFTVCCETVEIDKADCVFDPVLGDGGCWRPARGEDIEGLGGLEATDWSIDAHATHQDPNGLGCQEFVGGISAAELDAAGVSAAEVLQACYRRLGVANQRGFCFSGAAVNYCPFAQPSYRDACEQINDAEGLADCG